jgi:FtsP/CotA-like multicopper oxidase with cupredoxin domain
VPVRVREGERVLFRLLNASATENIRLALPGLRFTVLTLDGNPVPTAVIVDVLYLAPAERADVIVEMNRPGIWIMGEVDDDYRPWASASSSNTTISMASPMVGTAKT